MLFKYCLVHEDWIKVRYYYANMSKEGCFNQAISPGATVRNEAAVENQRRKITTQGRVEF